MSTSAFLALADGTIFRGRSMGHQGSMVGEVVFNTAMTGYQEILSDPSYCRQIVTLTYSHIGNVGTCDEDQESRGTYVSGLVIRDLPARFSNWRAQKSLDAYLKEHQVVGIYDVDTRALTRRLREFGAQSGVIASGDQNVDELVDRARSFAGLQGMDLAAEVTTDQQYIWREGEWQLGAGSAEVGRAGKPFKVVAYDFGVKHNILRILTSMGCEVTVVPATTSASEVLSMQADGVFLSNGPGDPEPCGYAITAIRELLAAAVPVFGICLGHQLLALACGAKTVKMKFGHHGANHPVKDLQSGRVMISSQNHGFAVDEESLPKELLATHRSLFDGSLQGIRHQSKPAYSFQGHPEASPGPHDVKVLFEPFITAMQTASA